MAPTARLVDLHVDWLLQYATETTLFDPALYVRIPQRLPQAEGYLSTTSATVVACYRRSEEWERQADPWGSLGHLIARVEAEFSGRILIDPDDAARWREDREGLTWAVIGIEGLDALVRRPEDLERWAGLVERGVRLVQPIYGASSRLGGSSAAGDDRGLTALGRALLHRLDDVVRDGMGTRLLLDLAHMNPRTASDVLSWLEADSARADRLIPVYSHGILHHEGCPLPRAITLDILERLRALGGVVGLSVGPPFVRGQDDLKTAIETAAALPWRGREGFEGIAIGTDFLGVDETAPGLRNAPQVVAWLAETFHPPVASALIADNARALFGRVLGE